MATAPHTNDTIVCYCLRVTESQIRDAVECGDCRTLKEVMNQTCAGKGCTACHRRILTLLMQEQNHSGEASPICIAK